MSYLFLDVETTGLDPHINNMLTFGAALADTIQDEPRATFEVKIRPSVGYYTVHTNALEVNGIDLIAHDKVAISMNDARAQFAGWLLQHRTDMMTPVGYNVPFDLNFIHNRMFNRAEWRELGFDYHALDVYALVEFCIIKQKLPAQRRLVQVAEYFNLNTTGAHGALFDALLTHKVLRELIAL